MDIIPALSATALTSVVPAKHPAGCDCASCTRSREQSAAAAGSATGGRGTDTVNLSFAGSDPAGAATSAPGASKSDPASAVASRDARGRPLDDRQKAQLDELKKTDADVRRHEQAHLSAAGGLARGGIVLNYKPGPDGKLYAVGGHVDIDTSPVKGDPTATLAKMATVQRAALAPADPSGQDRSVAVQAEQTANQARAELARQSGPQAQEDQQGQAGGTGSPPQPGVVAGTAAAGLGVSTGRGLTLTTAKAARATSSRANASVPSAANVGAGQLVDVMG